jgi:hypothetical protein
MRIRLARGGKKQLISFKKWAKRHINYQKHEDILLGYCISATGRIITFTMRLRGRGMAASTTASATSSAVEKPVQQWVKR